MTVRFLVSFLMCAAALSAQTASNLSGVIHDPSGAEVAGATISARSTSTGLLRETTSDRDGRFWLASLPAGTVEVRVAAKGFRPLVRKGIELTVNETAIIDLALEIGAVDQEITVTAAAQQVNTATGELGYLVPERSIRELPLNGRNYTDLAFLQPGVVAYPHRDGGSVVAVGMGASINGQDPRSNMYLIDGTPQNNFTNGPAGSAASTALGVETIREFRVEANAYSAEFGRNSGGQINVITKSGSNNYHGTVYEFLRNDNFDARNFFDPSNNPEFKRNQFGANIGGPIQRDKSFFFLGYEGLRERLGKTITSNVPDADARRGVIAGATIPISPLTAPFLNEFPIANGPSIGGGLAQYTFGFNQTIDQHFVQGRFDRNIGEKGQFFTRYTFDNAVQFLPTDYPQFPRSFYSRNQFVTSEYRHVHSAQTISTFRGNFSRTRFGQNVEANTSAKLTPFIPGRDKIGSIDIGGMPRFGTQSTVDFRNALNVFGFEHSTSLIRGRHIIKFGELIERYRSNMVNPTFGLGVFTFNDLRSFLTATPSRFVGLTPEGQLDRYWRFNIFAGYVQDNWRISNRLTLNLGLRYEFSSIPKDKYGRDVAMLNVFTDATLKFGQPYQNPTKKNISPRIGFAYDVFGNGRTSLRGGFGIFYNTNNQQNLIVSLTNPPYTPRVIITNPTFPVPPFERGVGNSLRPYEWNIKNPYVNVWNFNIQQQLPFEILITAGYAGSRGIHLWRSTDINTPAPARLADGTLFWAAGLPRPNPNWSTIELKRSDGNSWYNAGLLEIRKRFSRGLNFQSAYTFSRNIDTTQASTFFSDATNGTTSALPEFPGFNYNKGLADYHSKHNWVANVNYELPFARDTTGATHAALAGWELSSIWNVRSGNPLTAFVSGNPSRSQWNPSLGPQLGQDRPNMAPGRTHDSVVTGNPLAWMDVTAFTAPAAGTLGNLGRGTFIGPNLRTVDMAVLKNFTPKILGDSGRIQFRAEAFNILNRANFGIPILQALSGSTPIATFGRIRNTITSARQIQFALKVTF